jgi:hypothetical protein
MEKLRTDRSKASDEERSKIYSIIMRHKFDYPLYHLMGFDLHVYPKYDAYAMWINPRGGILETMRIKNITIVTPKEEIEKGLLEIGRVLGVI